MIFPQIRPALLGGTLVVGLALLAEFGAFEILDFRTFTTEIFAELKIDQSGAAALALLLVTLGIVVLLGEAAGSGRRRISRSGPQAARPPGRVRLGPWRLPVLAGLAALAAAALGVPVGTLAYWLAHSHTTTLPASTTLLAATAATARYSAAAAVLATAAAVPVALLAAQRRGRLARAIQSSTLLIQSVPGVVIALSLVFFAVRYAPPCTRPACCWSPPARCCSSRSRWSACGPRRRRHRRPWPRWAARSAAGRPPCSSGSRCR